jgi:DNA-binding MarR family transcriptional regulator
MFAAQALRGWTDMSCHDIFENMSAAVSITEYRALAEVRHQIRRFLTFSEARAREVEIEPQQHQLLLAVRGLPADLQPTIGRLAERLQIQPNSAVDLINRSAGRRLLRKRANPADRRQVQVELTAKGARVLEKLALAHRTELRSLAPSLIAALSALVEAENVAAHEQHS